MKIKQITKTIPSWLFCMLKPFFYIAAFLGFKVTMISSDGRKKVYNED